MKHPDAMRASAFIRLLHAFQSVERIAYSSDISRRENDVEHSYFLAMFCWYLVDALELEYSTEKILRYALAHDLVETYAGDTYIFDAEAKKTKKEREEKARLRIVDEFPEFKGLHATIECYERQEDVEAAFVHAIDKLLPLIINYIQEGRVWKDMNVAHAELFAKKRESIRGQKEAQELLEQVIAVLESDLKTYFSN